MSYTFLEVESRLSQAIGDDLEFNTTTTIPGGAATITSTTLNNYDSGQNDAFNNWWVYITGGNNITANRHVSDYTTSGGVLAVRGDNLALESGAVTCRLHRYNRDYKKWAINRALEELYPALYQRLDDMTLITNNALPDGHFEDWTSTSALRFYSTSSTTLLKTSSSAGLTRGGLYSAKSTASGTGGYFYISSDTYPRLLDLAGHTITVKAWSYPQTANDPTIVIYTIKPDGTTTQTLTSTTTAAAGKYTQIKLEDQVINTDIEEIQIRFVTATNGQYVYWDDARIEAPYTLHEYMIPPDFRLGHISQVLIQRVGSTLNTDWDMCDDIRPQLWDWVEHRTFNDNTYEYLYLPASISSNRRMRLVGERPFTIFSADTDTITLDAQRVELLVACAAYKLFNRLQTPVSSTDKTRFANEISRWNYEYTKLLSSHSMPTLSRMVRTS